jgi:crotonobetainyl-CoA:carnitine CoA-transferase CaiB-like acyl-CoA transferase
MSGPLEGIRVVDVTAMITGPFATMMLADQGADVVKIEPPGFGDFVRYIGSNRGGVSTMFASCNRGKRSVVLDLGKDEGRELARELAANADVFIQNFRPGVIDRLGLGEAELRREHPELIYVSLCAFGETGPFADKPAYDHILQGMTGAAYVQGEDSPEYMRQAWVDKSTALTAAQAITAALFARERGGSGQHVKLSMLDAGLAFLWPDGHPNTMLLEEDATRLPGIASTYVPVVTKDGFATVAAVTGEQTERLLIATDRADLLVDPRFATPEARLANLDAFRAEIADGGGNLTTAELTERLQTADVPVGPILRTEEIPAFEQIVANGSLVESEHPQLGRIREPRPAVRFETTPSEIRRPSPALGEHTDEVLRELGRTDEEIAKLRADGAAGPPPG